MLILPRFAALMFASLALSGCAQSPPASSLSSADAAAAPADANAPAAPAAIAPPPPVPVPKLLAGVAIPGEPRPRVYVVGLTSGDEASRRTAELLKKPVKALEFTRLIHVVDFLRKETQINLFVDWSWAPAGITKEIPPTVQFPGGSVESLLRLAIKHINHEIGDRDDQLDLAIRDGVVHIAPQRVLLRHTVTRLYVLPATALQPSSIDPLYPPFDLDKALGSGSSEKAFGRGAAALFADGDAHVVLPNPLDLPPGEFAEAATYEERMEQIITLIQDSVGHQSQWQAYGGEISSIRELHGVFIVRTTPALHAEVEQMLERVALPWVWRIAYSLRTDEVVHIVRQAEALRLASKYEAALALAEDAVKTSPDDARAIALRHVLLQTLGRDTTPAKRATINGPIVAEPPVVGPAPRRDPVPRNSEFTPAEKLREAAAAKLRRPITIAFEGNKLVNVVEYFSKTFEIPFEVNWAALEAAGIEQDIAITLSLRDVPGDVALSLVVQQAAGASNLEPLAFDVANVGDEKSPRIAIAFSTRRDLDRTTDVRGYSIADLIEWGGDDYAPNLMYAWGHRGLIGSMQWDAKAGDKATADERIEQICSLLQDLIGYQTEWAAYGGEVSSLRELRGALIIKSTPARQHQIEELLEDLRQARVLSTISMMQHRQVMGLLRVAEKYRLTGRHDEAMARVTEALRIDARHEYALAMKQVIEETMARRKAAGK